MLNQLARARVEAVDPVRVETAAPGAPPDESPRADRELEWWFVQGQYEGEGIGRRHFMSALFKHRNPKERESRHGFMLLLSVLDEATRAQRALHLVDRRTVELAAELDADLHGMAIDPRLLSAYRDELEACGPPAPIVMESVPVELRSSPFRARWGDFTIAQAGSRFDVGFREPGTGVPCSFEITPTQPRLYIEGIGEPFTRPLSYATYPSMRLVGTVGAQNVRGHAWLDHQWGAATGWLLSRSRRKRLLGYEWFGINLDDGTELMLVEHRDMKARRSLGKCGIVREQGGRAQVLRQYTATPIGFWDSEATRARYPVRWRIVIPSLQADFVFEPLAHDQELRLLGILRSVWEGAGRVDGVWRGRLVSGRARLELHGYGYVFDMKSYFARVSKDIDAQVESVFPRELRNDELQRFLGPPQWRHDAGAYNETIARPVWELMSQRGKQWRPMFNLLLLDALGVASRDYVDLASAIPELCHTGSLIIDDIEDDSKTRRGSPCVHLRHGLDVAINAANTLYFLPFQLIAEHPRIDDAQRVEIYKLVFRAFARAHFGQAQDIHWSRSLSPASLARWHEVDFGDRILQMYADKTAAFIEAGAEMACIVARAGHETRAACVAFTRALGVAFQITDDVLNFSASPRWGKTRGEDLQAGKTTYVIYRAMQALPPADRESLARIVCSKRLRKQPTGLQQGIDLVVGSGALERCREQARTLIDAAWKELSLHVPPSEPKIMLRLLCASLIEIADGA